MHFAWKTTIAIAAAVLMTAPATAEWYAYGSFEPDTKYDLTTMFVDPPAPSESRVYFHAMPTTSYSTITRPVNPNVGALKTQIEPLGVEYHNAYLGVWQDCNGDGYIGLAEGAQREYPSSLLSSTIVCPPVTGSANGWIAGAYNYNGWVSEFIPIVPTGTTAAIDRRVYVDGESRVWGDFHRPDEDPFHRSCTLRPFARGTLQDTGGFVNYVDCRVDLLGPANDAFAAIGDPLGLSFADEDDARTGTLGQVDIGGPEDDSHSPATVWDCSGDPAFRVGTVINGTGVPYNNNLAIVHNVDVFPVSPAPGNLDHPTLAGLVNHTVEGTQDCDTSNDFGHDLYEPVSGIAFETDFNGVDPKNKREADWNFNVSGSGRGIQSALLSGPTPLAGTGGAPGDLGFGNNGMRWVSDSTFASKTGPRSVRVDLESGGVAIAPAYWLTFYANVGTATTGRGLAVPAGGAGVYGSWHCGDNDSGIHHGWNCDETTWYRNPDGSYPDDPTGNLAKVGWAYKLRDVDCYDGRIGDTGVSVQPAFYGTEPCIPVS